MNALIKFKSLFILLLLSTVFTSCKKEEVKEIKPLEVSVIEVLQQDVRLES